MKGMNFSMIDDRDDDILRMIEGITGIPKDIDAIIPTKRKYRKKSDQETELVVEDCITETTDQVIVERQVSRIAIPITSFTEWMKRYKTELPEGTDIKSVTAGVKGVNSDEYLFLSIPHPKGGFLPDGNRRRELLIFKNADKIPVLDLPVSEISVYNSGFRMVHVFNEYRLKCYGGKSNYLIVSMANQNLIPYYIVKVKNNNAVLFKENTVNIEQQLTEPANREIVKTLYKVIANTENWSTMRSNGDMCEYFLNLQKDIRDNLHHIKIDNIMIGLMTGEFPTNETASTHVGRQILRDNM